MTEMQIETAKKMASAAGLELYYDRQWTSWGLIDPAMRVESLWLSPNQLKGLHREDFEAHYITVMCDRVKSN
jgi:hypothetical protein